jgi:drug/metabolite transporter (DMT)-like permease
VKRAATNYLLLLGVGAIWGSQFMLNELAIAAFPPDVIATGRTVIGFLTLAVLVLATSGRRDQPATTPGRTTAPLWGLYFLIGMFEATLPFYLVAWGQERVDSAIAAILMGTVAIFAIILAALFVKGERLRLGNASGVALGFVGVVVLVGPSALRGLSGSILGELAVLTGALSFAVSLTLIKRLPAEIPVIVKARNILLCASVQIVPLTLVLGRGWALQPTWPAVLAVLALGTLCAGVVYVLFVALIDRAGPTFASFSNFLVPVFGVALGVLFLGEQLTWTDAAALALIILGLAATHLPANKAAQARMRETSSCS